MNLVDAKCTNCAGVLKVDDSKEAAVCPYCGSAYIVEKAIQNFNITNNLSVANATINLNGANIQVGDKFDLEGHLNRAKQAFQYCQFKEAEVLFKAVAEKHPDNESANTGLMFCVMMEACLNFENEVFRRVPDSGKQQLLYGTAEEYVNCCKEFGNKLLKAKSYSPDNYFVVLDYFAVRASRYEEKYRLNHKFQYYTCCNTYYTLFSRTYNNFGNSNQAMLRMQYYEKYKEPALGIFGQSWSDYVSFDQLIKMNLIGEDRVYIKVFNHEEMSKVDSEYVLHPYYNMRE